MLKNLATFFVSIKKQTVYLFRNRKTVDNAPKFCTLKVIQIFIITMKRLSFYLLISTISALVCVAKPQPQQTPTGAAIYVEAPFALTFDRAKAGEGVHISQASWMKQNKERGISALMRTSYNWKVMKFSFTPTQDGEVKITFRNKFFRDEKKQISKNRK